MMSRLPPGAQGSIKRANDGASEQGGHASTTAHMLAGPKKRKKSRQSTPELEVRLMVQVGGFVPANASCRRLRHPCRLWPMC